MKSSLLVLLSGERTSIPEAEARALVLTYDSQASFTMPEPRVLIAETTADPEKVAGRVAFARRVGVLLSEPVDASRIVRGKRIRFRSFSLGETPARPTDVASVLRGLDAEVDLENPDYEFTEINGRNRYLGLSIPRVMKQTWSSRRPRRRPFFHPSAIFPKLSRALVNLTRCREGDIFLDPFAGTGSIPLEASEVGLVPVSIDRSRRMAEGSLANMTAFGQTWLGVIRADAFFLPLLEVDGVATDIPYGRASSTGGMTSGAVMDFVVDRLPAFLKTGGRLVIMHPSQVHVGSSSELSVEEEHYIYIHRKLTRAITILRKT